MEHQITYTAINRQVAFKNTGQTLLDISIGNGIPHLHECGGNGVCTTCRVRVLDGIQNLSPKTAFEQSSCHARKWDPSIRLACQARPKGDVTIQRLIWSSGEVNNLQKELAPEGRAEERPIAIIFCDIRNFTNLSSHNLNFDIAYMLNKFYTALGEPILMNNGVIYQYVGDEIIGVFGTSGGTARKNCEDAIRAALGMQYALDTLNRTDLKDIQVKLKSGIGINFGTAFIGHLGHPTHKQFSVIGDPVNVASRIQDETKATQTNILVSETILENVDRETILTGRSFHSKLAGKDNPVHLHELLGFKNMDLQLELQASMNTMLEDEDQFAAIFYEKVFAEAPFVRALFRKNMTDQGRLLTHMLGGIVYSLSRPEHLKRGLARLGQNHVQYGVKAAYYPIIKKAMLETIDEVLGENKTPQTLQAWHTALDFVIDAMKSQAHPPAHPMQKEPVN
ncbi:adenylate/guanylate cyclase domain-containing protein [Robiginitalea sp. SC105]|uniref:adenylate/guanylate cyclase domain-containing protein n=1 Tax=Robiginitalea sp. SC105 TaxID=2762332 RepID=UPI00163AE3B4|nr:adenylate/guanylate cyclase domain-containing protein [Robiginitalea sp. SC105]MBC2838687.1 2Fe-2S iron-sulfur cluster binding domain-containing protein [Robiginitalea sp. SC105]